jgi:autotransporter-associated beta strand protein
MMRNQPRDSTSESPVIHTIASKNTRWHRIGHVFINAILVAFAFAASSLGNVSVKSGTSTVSIPGNAGAVDVLASGGTPSVGTITGGTTTTITYLSGPSGSGTISAGTSTSTASLIVNGGSYGGILADNTVGTGILALTKATSDTLTLYGPNTYSGGTALNAGHLRVANDSALGTGILTIAGGQLSGSDGTSLVNDVAVTNGTSPGGTVSVILGQVSDNQDPTLGLTMGNIALNNNAQLRILSGINISGVISGSGSMVKSGSGILLLAGPNSYTGGTRIEEGEIRVANNTALGIGKLTMIGGALSGDAVHLVNAIEIGLANSAGLTSVGLGQSGDAGAPTLLILNGATTIQQTASITVPEQANVILAGTISGKGFVKEGPGTLYLQNAATNSGVNSYEGKTVLKEGVLGLSEKTDLGHSSVQFLGGTLDLSDVAHRSFLNNAAVDTYDIAQVISAIEAGYFAKFIGGIDSAHRTEFATGLSGLGGLELISGTLQVAAVNSYSGQTTVNEGGNLVLPVATSIASSTKVLIKGTLDGSANGFAFRSGQPIEIQNGGNNLGVLKIKDGTADWTNADLSVDVARHTGAVGAGIAQTGVVVNGTSSAISGVTLKLIPRVAYTIGAKQIESSTPVELKDYFTAFDANGMQITDRTRIGAVSGTIISARPIYSVGAANELTWSRQSYSVFGSGTNGETFGEYLDKQISATSSNALPTFLRDVVDPLTQSSQITQILKEMSAAPFADAYRAGVQRWFAVLKGVEDRFTSLEVRGSEDAPSRKFGCKQVTPFIAPIAPSNPAAASFTSQADSTWSAWSGVYGREDSDKSDNAVGVSKASTSESGIQFGVEHQVGDLTLGLTGATGWGRRHSETPWTDISSESWHLGMYAVAPFERVVLDSSFIYGTATNQSKRTPHLSTFTGNEDITYHGVFDSRDLSISLGISYHMMAPQMALQAAPTLRLIYLNYGQSALSESEASDWAYRVGSVNASKVLSRLGYRISYKKELSKSVELEADLGTYWQHDWDNKSSGLDASLNGGVSGTSYQVLGGKDSSDIANFNCGLQLNFNKRYWLRASGALECGGAQQSLTGMAIFGVNF